MDKYYNGKHVVSVSIGKTIINDRWRFTTSIFKKKRRWKYFTDCFSFKTESYFGWENDNQEDYIVGNDIYIYPWVTIEFVNGNRISKRFQTDDEAIKYCEKIKMRNFDASQTIKV